MSFFGNTISKSSQRLGERMDYANRIIGYGHISVTKPSLMHVGISAICLPISNEQNKSYASDRGMT